MRFFHVSKANIEPELRTTLEQYGTAVIQQILSVAGSFRYKGQTIWIEEIKPSVLAWLTERHDIEELKETWHFAMEVAITVLVTAELGMSILLAVRNVK